MEEADLDELFAEADRIAQSESTDAEMKVGAAVLVDHAGFQDLVAAAANTFVAGAKGLPDTRPDKYEFMIHAEQNLIFFAAAEGLA